MKPRLADRLGLVACLALGILALGPGRASAGEPPLVETGAADHVPSDGFPDGIAQLNGQVTAFGTQLTECYFEYGPTTAYGMRAEAYGEGCNPDFSPVGDDPMAVAGKLLNPSPNVVYHYRLAARNAFGLGVGSDRTFGTAGGETPPGDDPGEGSPATGPAPGNPTAPGSPASDGSAPPPSGSSGCPAVKLIGVRGSDEPQGLGKPVGAFARALAADLDMRPDDGRYATVAINYRAYLPSFRHWYSGAMEAKEYQRSVRGGTKALDSVLAHDPCRSHSRYVLAGYSQGAQVIGDAIAGHDLRGARDRIVATVFFGDPTFDATMSGIEFSGSFSPRRKGLLHRLGTRHRDSFRGYEVLSYCRRLDPFCQSDIDAASHGRVAGHEHYQDQEAARAARLVAARLR